VATRKRLRDQFQRETVKFTAPLVPADVDTFTLLVPVAAEEEIVKVAVIRVELTTVILLAVTPEPLTAIVAAEMKFVPVRVTATLLPCFPLTGEIEVSVGAGVLTVKVTGLVVPAEVVTVTSLAPAAAVPQRSRWR
jgi:hypothetical protein